MPTLALQRARLLKDRRERRRRGFPAPEIDADCGNGDGHHAEDDEDQIARQASPLQQPRAIATGVGKTLAKIPCTVEIASEYRYRDRVPHANALVVVVSQSGETADTLAALKHAKSLGHRHTLTICNVATSTMVRQTELTFLTRAGTEVGVASTKAFTTQLVAEFLLALTLAKLRGHLTPDAEVGIEYGQSRMDLSKID